MHIIVDDLMISYGKWGTGPKLLLALHGWADNATTFAALAKELGDEYTVIAPDMPGFGGSQQPTRPWHLADYATFLQHFLAKLGCGKINGIIGHSNGGAIAITGLADGKLEADKLILIASAGVRTTTGQAGHRLVWQSIAKLGKLATVFLPMSIKTELRRHLYQAAGSDMLLHKSMQDTFKLVVHEDLREQAVKLRIPTLCIYGEQDDATPVKYGTMLAERIRDSRLVTIPHAGHFVHQERAREVAELIKDFLA